MVNSSLPPAWDDYGSGRFFLRSLFQQLVSGCVLMSFYEEVKGYLEEIKEENENFSKAQNPEEEIEALKEMMDGFMQGAQRTRKQIDHYNDRRWQR